MARLLEGGPAARSLLGAVAKDAAALQKRGELPALGIVRLGDRDDDISYEKGIKKRAEAAGIGTRQFLLPENSTTAELLKTIGEINRDATVQGALIFRPLPPGIDDRAVCAALDPAKDLDGITPGSLGAVYSGDFGQGGFAPCTAEACIAILDQYGIELSGKSVVVIGRSLVIGRPAALLCIHRNATVTVCHSRTADLPRRSREADIVIAALGKKEFLGAEYFRPGQTVIDVGIHVREDGTLCGDVKFAEAEPLVEAITPVPGGVGSVTTAVLLKHLVSAAG